MAISSTNGPGVNGFKITPSDANTLPSVTRSIHANASGNVNIVWLNGTSNTNTVVYVVQGQTYPYRATKIMATGTTATDLVGIV